ncbi:MAG: insulinase family protein, partial [Muribaculaceae bacterium]|nr:insulinase family protein [Muribaculaceae bacterium]
QRLEDNAVNPDCKYSGAGVYFGDFYVSKTKDSFNVVTIPKKGTQGAVAEVMGIVARACKTGFTEAELDRVRTELLASLENQYNEREKTDNANYGSELCKLFIDNTPAPGIEAEFEILKSILPMLPLAEINKFASGLLTEDNMVIVTSEPEKDGFEVVAEDVLVKTVKDAMEAEYEVMVDEVITEPLISKLPKKGKIVKKEENKGLGYTTYTLSNGTKVVVKSTDFSADEILMTAFSDGGKASYKESEAANVKLLGMAFGTSKVGPFDNKTLSKYLAGKQVGVSLKTGLTTNMIDGSSTVKDLPTFMELLYSYFTALTPDQATFDVARENYEQRLKNAMQNPQMIFSMRAGDIRYGGNKLMTSVTPEEVASASYPEMLEMIHSLTGNAADFTFVFTGNIDEAVFLPLVEQYIATLPSKKKKTEVKKVSPVAVVEGQIADEFKQPMQVPSTIVFDLFHGHNLEMNVKNDVLIEMLGDILDNIYIATLREEEGGTY